MLRKQEQIGLVRRVSLAIGRSSGCLTIALMAGCTDPALAEAYFDVGWPLGLMFLVLVLIVARSLFYESRPPPPLSKHLHNGHREIDPRVIEGFRLRASRTNRAFLLVLVGFGSLAFSSKIADAFSLKPALPVILGFLAAFAGGVLAHHYYRCPACERLVGNIRRQRFDLSARSCPHCDVQLR